MRTSVIFFLLALTAAAHAQAPSTFREGVLAFEKKEWARAEQLMRQTIAGNPNESEGTVSISGSWFETYVPHYFLARALAKQGKCSEALVEFAETERQGVTPNIPDFARHVANRGGCRPQARRDEPKPAGEVVVPFGEGEAQPAKPRVETPPAKPPVKPPVTPPVTPTVQPPLKPAVQAPAVEPKPRVEDVEARTRLTAAVRAYLEGKYDVALTLLGEAPFADRNAAAEAALFRAASRDAIYRIGGARDEALRRLVEEDLRAYRSLRPNRKPDPRIFPPRFIAMARP